MINKDQNLSSFINEWNLESLSKKRWKAFNREKCFNFKEAQDRIRQWFW